MQFIQGVVVPRCFGMLLADIPYDTEIIPRTRDDIIVENEFTMITRSWRNLTTGKDSEPL